MHLPKHGDMIVFSVIPIGSYCLVGKTYLAERRNGHTFRFVRIGETGRESSTYDEPWAVARSTWYRPETGEQCADACAIAARIPLT